MACAQGFGRDGEFVVFDDCIVPVVLTQVIDATTIVVVTAFVVSMAVLLMCRRMKRPRINDIIIGWTMVQQIFMGVRPALSLLGFHATELWVGLVVHGTTAMMASVPLLFMYIELKILLRGSIKTRGRSLRSIQWILGTMIALEVVLFMGLPVLCWWLNAGANIAFWVPVIVVDFTAIPYFCFLGISIYLKIRTLEQHKKTSRHILTVVIICGVLGFFTGSAGIVAAIVKEVDWFLVRACWLAAITFSEVIFVTLIGRSS